MQGNSAAPNIQACCRIDGTGGNPGGSGSLAGVGLTGAFFGCATPLYSAKGVYTVQLNDIVTTAGTLDVLAEASSNTASTTATVSVNATTGLATITALTSDTKAAAEAVVTLRITRVNIG